MTARHVQRPAAPPPLPHLIPEAIAKGHVRPWHLLFLYSITFVAAIVASHYWTRGSDRSLSPYLRLAYIHAATCLVVVFLSLSLRELRQALPALLGRGRVNLSLSDAAIVLGLLLTWAAGVIPLIFILPVALFVPGGYDLLGMRPNASFSTLQLFVLAAVASTLAPLTEELIYRGYLLNLWALRWRLWAGVLLSSLVFAAFHLILAPFALGFGLILALVYLRHGTLWPGILLHSLYNLLAIATGLGYMSYSKHRDALGSLSTWTVEICLAILFVPLAVLFWRRYRPTP